MQAFLTESGLESVRMGRPAQHPRPAYGQHLAELREAAGLTQQQLAGKLGLPQSNITFGNGRRSRLAAKFCRSSHTPWVSVWTVARRHADQTQRQGARGRLRRVSRPLANCRAAAGKNVEVVEAMVEKHSKAA